MSAINPEDVNPGIPAVVSSQSLSPTPDSVDLDSAELTPTSSPYTLHRDFSIPNVYAPLYGAQVEEQAEQDEPMTHGVKRPREWPCVTDDDGQGVDLVAYFETFELSNQEIIAICRTFANHLAQVERIKIRKRTTH